MAVIIATPSFFAEIMPLSSTDTVLSSLDDQITAGFVALAGSTDTDSVSRLPAIISLCGAPAIATESTGITGIAVTVTVISLDTTDFPLYTAVALTLAVPALFAVTIPLSLSTDAISGWPDSHVISALPASASGFTETVSANVSPTSNRVPSPLFTPISTLSNS